MAWNSEMKINSFHIISILARVHAMHAIHKLHICRLTSSISLDILLFRIPQVVPSLDCFVSMVFRESRAKMRNVGSLFRTLNCRKVPRIYACRASVSQIIILCDIYPTSRDGVSFCFLVIFAVFLVIFSV